jgi:hypothetical protein
MALEAGALIRERERDDGKCHLCGAQGASIWLNVDFLKKPLASSPTLSYID